MFSQTISISRDGLCIRLCRIMYVYVYISCHYQIFINGLQGL